jgi:hypothetical protein
VAILHRVCIHQRQVLRGDEDLITFLECVCPAVLVGLCNLQFLGMLEVTFKFNKDVGPPGSEAASILRGLR